MPKKKPFRVIKDSYLTGRFSREDARRAVIAVMLEDGEITQERAGVLLRELEEEVRRGAVREHAA